MKLHFGIEIYMVSHNQGCLKIKGCDIVKHCNPQRAALTAQFANQRLAAIL